MGLTVPAVSWILHGSFNDRGESTMTEYRSLSHTKWDCQYPIVVIPKRRQKVIYGQVRRRLGERFHALASHKEVEIVEGHLRPDQVHRCLRIPPKYAVSTVVGYLKGKSAIMIARFFVGKERNCTGENFGARGYFVSTVGLDEATVIEYLRNQEAEAERHEQMKLHMPL